MLLVLLFNSYVSIAKLYKLPESFFLTKKIICSVQNLVKIRNHVWQEPSRVPGITVELYKGSFRSYRRGGYVVLKR